MEKKNDKFQKLIKTEYLLNKFRECQHWTLSCLFGIWLTAISCIDFFTHNYFYVFQVYKIYFRGDLLIVFVSTFLYSQLYKIFFRVDFLIDFVSIFLFLII